MKYLFALCLAGSCGLIWAQTNAPAQKTPEQNIDITSETGHWDGKTSQMIYLGHVFVTYDVKAKMRCGRLTVDVPTDGSHPTNMVADGGVVIDYLDAKGQTNTITSEKAIYFYSTVTNLSLIVTNETVTFTGGTPMPQAEGPQYVFKGEPLIYDFVTKQFSGSSNFETHFKIKSGTGTNASPFNFLK
jgi:lipopolysaccharide export system protein LptA